MLNDQAVRLVKCPVCGQKLFQPVYGNGETTIRIKCRRCRTFSTWVITNGNPMKIAE